MIVLPLIVGLACPPAWSLPSGYTVESGNVTFDDTVTGELNVTASDNAIISFNNFSIGDGELVRFFQNSSDSSVLLRDSGGNAWNIYGALLSNGQLVMVNPQGINFHTGADIQVQGLIASTLEIQNANFLAGNMTFEKVVGSSLGEIMNQANITSGTNGHIILLGESVQNTGNLTSYMGTVALSAGEKQTLQMDSDGLIHIVIDRGLAQTLQGQIPVNNTGDLTAQGGLVQLSAKDLNQALNNLIHTEGNIEAMSVVERDGEVVLSAEGGIVTTEGTILATDVYITTDTIVQAGNTYFGVEGDWNNQGHFEAQNSEVEFVNANRISTLLGSTTFNDFRIAAPDKVMIFEAGKTQGFTGSVFVRGARDQGADEFYVKFRSSEPGVSYMLDFYNSAATEDRVFLERVNLSDAHSARYLYIDIGVDAGGNVNILVDPVWDGGGGDNYWSNSFNWDGNAVPTGGEWVTFDATSTKDCEIDNVGDWSGKLVISDTYTGTITQNAAMTVNDAGTAFVQSGGTYIQNAALIVSGNMLLDAYGGNTAFTGSAAALTISGNLTLTGGVGADNGGANGGSVTFTAGTGAITASSLSATGGTGGAGGAGGDNASDGNAGGSGVTGNSGGNGDNADGSGSTGANGADGAAGATGSTGSGSVGATGANGGNGGEITVHLNGAFTLTGALTVQSGTGGNGGTGGNNTGNGGTGGNAGEGGNGGNGGDGDVFGGTGGNGGTGGTGGDGGTGGIASGGTGGIGGAGGAITFNSAASALSIGGGLIIASGASGGSGGTGGNTGSSGNSGGSSSGSAIPGSAGNGNGGSAGTGGSPGGGGSNAGFGGSASGGSGGAGGAAGAATFNAPTGTMYVAGGLTNGGTFNSNSGRVDFNGTGSLNMNGSSLYDFTHSAGTLTLQNALTATHNFTNSGGTFSLNSLSLTLSGSAALAGGFSNTGTFQLRGNETITGLTSTNMDTDSGTFEYAGDGAGGTTSFTIKDFGATDYYNLTINARSDETFRVGSTVVMGSGGALTTTGSTLQIGTGAAGGSLTLAGTADINALLTFDTTVGTTAFDVTGQTVNYSSATLNLTNADTFTTTGSTWIFDGTTALTSSGKTFNNVTIGTNAASGSVTLADTTDINGNLAFNTTGGTATLNSTNRTVTFAGSTLDLSSADTFTTTGSTWTLDGSGAQTITDAGTWNALTLSTRAAGTVDFQNNVTATTLTVNGAGAYGVSFEGASNTFTDAVTFSNTGGVTLGDQNTDITLFNGGATSTASTTTARGIIRTSGDTLQLGTTILANALTIDTTNNGGTATGGNLTLGAVTGTSDNLTLNSGTDGDITVASGSGITTFIVTQSDDATVTGTFSAATVLLSDTDNTVTFGGNLTATTLLATAQGYSVVFNGASNSVTNAVTFSNTGGVTFGDGDADTSTFNGGVTSTAGTTTLRGSLVTSNDTMTLGALTLAGATTLDSGGGNIAITGITGAGKDLTLAAGVGAGTTTVSGAVSNLGDGTGAALTVNNAATGLVTFQNTFGANSGLSAGAATSVVFKNNLTLAAGNTDSTFGNLTILDETNNSTNVTATFAAGSTVTVDGLLTLTGTDVDDRVSLESGTPATPWNFVGNGTFTMDKVTIADSTATGAFTPIGNNNTVPGADIVDGLGTTGWFAPASSGGEGGGGGEEEVPPTDEVGDANAGDLGGEDDPTLGGDELDPADGSTDDTDADSAAAEILEDSPAADDVPQDLPTDWAVNLSEYVTEDILDIQVDEESGIAYLADGTANQVLAVDLKTGEVMNTIEVGNMPSAMALSPDGQYLFVYNRLDQTVMQISTATGEVEGTWDVKGASGASRISISEDGTQLQVSNPAGAIALNIPVKA